MDLFKIIQMLHAAQEGDGDATETIREIAATQLLNDVRATQKLMDVKIDPGSFYLGQLICSRGIEVITDPEVAKHAEEFAEDVRERYANEEGGST